MTQLEQEILKYLQKFGEKGRQIPFVDRHVCHLLTEHVPYPYDPEKDQLLNTLNKLKDEGLIDFKKKQIVITEAGIERLERRMNHVYSTVTAPKINHQDHFHILEQYQMTK